MKSGAIVLALAFLVVGCSKTQDAKVDAPSQPVMTASDNDTKVAGEGQNESKTSSDQGGAEADRTISQKVHQAVNADDSVSAAGKNIKIVTVDGKVTLRGAVKDQNEKNNIGAKALQIAGVKNVDNQLEITF